MTDDWETRKSIRAQERRRQALAEERAAIQPIRRTDLPLDEWMTWSCVWGEGDKFETVTTADGKTYRVIT